LLVLPEAPEKEETALIFSAKNEISLKFSYFSRQSGSELIRRVFEKRDCSV